MNNRLIIDATQITSFVARVFAYAAEGTRVSLRAFGPRKSGKRSFIRDAVIGSGPDRFDSVISAAVVVAQFAADAPDGYVFSPPTCTFRLSTSKARSEDVAQGLTFSVELDDHPGFALRKLTLMLGTPTLTVASGGTAWNMDDGDEPKLHVYWRLSTPAVGEQALATLKAYRARGAALVGGDSSNGPVVHPMRWPGSWHRKAEPVLCRIIEETDAEITLQGLVERLGVKPTKIRAGASTPKQADLPVALQDDPSTVANITPWLQLSAETAPTGERHATGYRVAGAVKDAGISALVCFDLMLEHWNVRNRPPLAFDDLESVVRSAYLYGRRPIGWAHPHYEGAA